VIAWPVRVFLEGAESLARISEQEVEKTQEQRTEEGIEALVEAAEEEGIIEPEQADLIEQVVEFSDKRVREVMTPRPDIVAIAADSSLEDLHAKVVETRFARIPVFEKSLDDLQGVVYAQDLLQVADADLTRRKVRELMRPVLLMPETKVASELLKEMRQKNQPVAVIIDEHGSVAGIATLEDLVEEIVGESTKDALHPAPELVKEADGGLLFRGSTPIDRVEEILGVHFGKKSDETVTTIAGLLSHVGGKVPAPGEQFDLEGYRFEVLEANQRKVLRLRARKQPAGAHAS
jgi:CBS domain containing-hemolysin-like protein